ncbi:TIR domain-containing protein [Conexibacter woesei]|uniref:SLOG domain-containing protein n=1 Tax=Conexibacter woesei TaxID=191495 RepID=UPI0004038E1B|nr:TIR domain-containing protein [Conexibacter woesei]
MIYIVDSSLSEADGATARAFLDTARADLEIAPVSELRTVESIVAVDFDAADAVVFVNPPRSDLKDEIEGMLRRAAKAGAVVLPVALDAAGRRPPDVVGDRQSFDVADHHRRRGLTADQDGVVARAFSREALSKILPTYTKDHLRVFLCHRREDGEGLVASIGARLNDRHGGLVFRDLVEVQAGERAQERIDEELARADVLVFFDTPLAGESWWIAKELSGALGRNIPIVWVYIESEKERTPLPVVPGVPEPHVRVAAEDLDDERLGRLADTILEQAFDLSRAHVRASYAAIRALQDWAAEHHGRVEALDARLMVYELTRPVVERPYPTRAAVDVVQVFARHPTDEDLASLEQYLTKEEMGPHRRNCRAFDAAVLLDPTATGHRVVGDWSVVEHPERFLATLRVGHPTKRPASAPAPRLLILGAFPSGDLGAFEVTTAIQVLTTTWLDLGGALVFGGHPTFTPLILEAARLSESGHGLEHVTMFQSKWYSSPAVLEDLESKVTVRAINEGHDRATSLTAMRMAMIHHGSADAVVAVGGRTAEGGKHVPGIDEEIGLARAARLPVHLLGATGGRAAELVQRARMERVPFETLGNHLNGEANQQLADGDDYAAMARMIWQSVADNANGA